MSDDIENHTLRLLREMRGEMRTGFASVNERLSGLETAVSGLALIVAHGRGELAGQIEAIETRLDRLERKTGLADEPAE